MQYFMNLSKKIDLYYKILRFLYYCLRDITKNKMFHRNSYLSTIDNYEHFTMVNIYLSKQYFFLKRDNKIYGTNWMYGKIIPKMLWLSGFKDDA